MKFILKPGVRVNSVSVEDVFFGDSGKGRVVAEFNRLLSTKRSLYSLRYNGGANAGHEVYVNGKQIVTHQLPMTVIQERATALMGRGMVIHPQDLVTELSQVKKIFKGKLPGKLLIDPKTPLCLDTHRALETVYNSATSGGKGSTGRGLATAYASFYLRFPVTFGDLYLNDWQGLLRDHYKFYRNMTLGFGKKFNLADIEVKRLGIDGKLRVGSEKDFINSLKVGIVALREYIGWNFYEVLKNAWENTKVAFTFEGAQGAGLDPYHGVYPDVTSSRPMSRFIGDSTYSIVEPADIAIRAAVMKTTYMSSVGQRILPTIADPKLEKWIQEKFDEKGRSTGRLRDIYPVSVPIAQYLKKAAGYQYLIATHLDASKGEKIKVITEYRNRKTGEKSFYLPYQDHLDKLEARGVEFKGWDGEEIKKIKSPKDLPKEAKVYLDYLGKNIAPVIFATTGPELGKNYLSWIEL
ncbi:adenylosuccinate synthetase [Candidatus Daviesbacteria bacterium]|nr:adenylosuccinate synthetase [Candidatus Daviesbacteria bacterium]